MKLNNTNIEKEENKLYSFEFHRGPHQYIARKNVHDPWWVRLIIFWTVLLVKSSNLLFWVNSVTLNFMSIVFSSLHLYVHYSSYFYRLFSIICLQMPKKCIFFVFSFSLSFFLYRHSSSIVCEIFSHIIPMIILVFFHPISYFVNHFIHT